MKCWPKLARVKGAQLCSFEPSVVQIALLKSSRLKVLPQGHCTVGKLRVHGQKR
jgi:hypothetical protein